MQEKSITIIEKLRARYPEKVDALLVLGAAFEWNANDAKWWSPPYIKHYKGIIVAGELRAAAASILYHLTPELAPQIIITGGSDLHPITKERVSRAVLLRDLMRDEYGIPEIKMQIIGQPDKGHTMGNVEVIVDSIKSGEVALQGNNLAVLSPRFQASRAKAMFKLNQEFTKLGINTFWILAERVIEEVDPSFKDGYSFRVYGHDLIYGSRLVRYFAEMEREGKRALENSNYRPENVVNPYANVNFDELNSRHVSFIRESFHRSLER